MTERGRTRQNGPAIESTPVEKKTWYSGLTGYQWLVFAVCTMGWSFDCLDQQLFALARKPAIADLANVPEDASIVGEYGGWATSIMLIGWATGGIFFGIMGDKIGRVKTMFWTILAYSLFTGLCGAATSVWMFILFRFLTGLGVGGQFAVGVALLAETMPDHARSRALGLLQVFASVGNILAAFIAIGLAHLTAIGVLPGSTWRWMFLIGVFPALLSVVVIRYLREPDAWKTATQSKEDKAKAGSLRELFGTPRWRYNVIIGMLLASVGVIGLWGIGFFSIDLNRTICRKWAQQEELKEGDISLDHQFIGSVIADPIRLDQAAQTVKLKCLLAEDMKNNYPQILYNAALELREANKNGPKSELTRENVAQHLEDNGGLSDETLSGCSAYLAAATAAQTESFDATVEAITARQTRIDETVSRWGSITSMLFNLGACFGIYAFAVVAERLGRRPTFTIFFTAAFFSTLVAFLCMKKPTDILWMVPLMGFFQLALFGGYTIYFPELFPTHLRSTAVSFCYNIGRYVAAFGPAIFGLLTHRVFNAYDEPMRYAGALMCGVFILGIVFTWMAPETKGQPLPE